MGKKVIAAAVHAAPVFMDKKGSIEKVLQLIKEGKDQEIELLVFPETFIPGYPVSPFESFLLLHKLTQNFQNSTSFTLTHRSNASTHKLNMRTKV